MIRKAAIVIDQFQLPLLILSAPIFLFPSPGRIVFFLIIPILWGVAWAVRGEPFPKTPLNSALMLLALMVIISLFSTFDIVFSLPKIAGLIFGISIYFAVVRWLNSSENLWLGIQIFLLAGGVLAMLGLLGTNWFVKFPSLQRIVSHLPPVIRGLPGAEEGFQPNAVAGAMVFFLPLYALLLTKGPRLWKRRQAGESLLLRSRVQFTLQATVFLLACSVFFLTQSRGAWLGLTVGILAILGWNGRRSRFILMAILLFVFVGSIIIRLNQREIFSWVFAHGGSGLAGSVEGRLEIWSRAISGIQDFPMTGMGMNTFRKVMPVLYPIFSNDPRIDVAHCHNHILQAALDLGIPGLVAYLALWLLTAYLLIYVFRHAKNPLHRLIASGLGAGLLAHFVFGIQDAIALGAKAGIFFWLTLALAVGVYRIEYKANRKTLEPK
jgi:putative inorganic carbon (HCO3(-)) transporter